MDSPAANSTALSNPSYNWEAEPKRRGTVGIISLCFSTMIICVWSTLHFDVPIRRYTVTRRFFLQMSWMIITLLAPEVLLCLAITERVQAGALVKKVLKFHPHLAKPGMFTRMYNWIRGRAESKDKRYNPIEQTPQPHFGLVHAFYAVMGGFAFYGSYDDDTPKSLFEISTNPRCPVDVPKFDALIYIMKHFPHIITDIEEDYILDQAASSSLSKALLIVQVGWFCTNCASRRFQGLPLSLLEVSTAAHALCTLLTYFVWWSKPINVATPTLLREREAREVHALFKCSDNEYEKALEMAREMAAGDSSMIAGTHGSEKILLAAYALQNLLPIPERPPPLSSFNNRDRMLQLVPGANSIKSSDQDISIPITMAISPILYGLVHFLAWSGRFPTPLERLLWRVSSFVVTCSGLVEIFVAVFFACLETWSKTVVPVLVVPIMFLVVPLTYVLGSGFLIVESVRQLSFLDDAAYQLPSWSNYWPHLS